MNRLSNADRARVLACLVEGNSIRATVRITGIAKKTVTRLGVELGEACERFADKTFRNLPCEQIQCDEIWSFCYAKAKNVPTHLEGTGAGDVWTWVAIDPITKLIPAWFVGDRTAQSAYRFMRNLEPRLANRVQLSTDGHHAYLWQVDKICTSHADRNNLTMRMGMRRFTRLTNGFSKKLDNHRLAIAVHFVHYNFCRVHQTLRVTPAMAAGLTDHVWELSELIGLLEAEELKLAA